MPECRLTIDREMMGIGSEVQEIAETPKRAAEWLMDELKWLLRVLFSSVERFYWDNGFSKAASLAYTSLFSLVPFVTLGFGILASFALSQGYIAGVEQFIVNQFVPAPEVAKQLLTFLESAGRNATALGVPMLAFFIISSILLINHVEYALNETWQVFEPRPWVHRVGAFSAIILIAPVLALSAYVFVKLRLEPFLAGFQNTFLHSLYNYLVPFFLIFAAFVCLYYMVPKAPVRIKSTVFGAFFTALLFLTAYAGFAVYIETNVTYDRMYGAISAVPIFLFWLYVFWTITLLGAEVTYQAQYLPRKGQIWRRSVHSVGDGKMVLAAQALIMIAKAFLEGKRMPDYLEIAERLGCSSVVLRPALDVLARAEIISLGNSREKLFTLMRSPDKITLQEISQVLFKGGSSMNFPAEMASLFKAFQKQNDPERVTLMDLVKSADA